jgi:hypothetical protein
MKSLEEAVNEFKDEAGFCDSQRLGQVHMVAQSILSTTTRIETETKKTGRDISQLTQGISTE